MEIKEPKFKVGDKVTTPQEGKKAVGTIEGIKFYDFSKGTYIYIVRLEKDGFTDKQYVDELVLDIYVEKPKSVWELKDGDECFFITDAGNVFSVTWDNWNVQIEKRKLGNVFLTKDEAEFERERRKIETEMLRLGGKRKAEQGKANWFLEYRPASAGIEALWSSYEMDQGVIYFESEEKAKKVVETIGEDRIKKYIFGVEE